MKDGFHPGVGPKLVFRMSRVRGKGSLAIGHHPPEDWETTHRLAGGHSQLSDARTQEWEQTGYRRRGWLRPQWPQMGQGMVPGWGGQ